MILLAFFELINIFNTNTFLSLSLSNQLFPPKILPYFPFSPPKFPCLLRTSIRWKRGGRSEAWREEERGEELRTIVLTILTVQSHHASLASLPVSLIIMYEVLWQSKHLTSEYVQILLQGSLNQPPLLAQCRNFGSNPILKLKKLIKSEQTVSSIASKTFINCLELFRN